MGHDILVLEGRSGLALPVDRAALEQFGEEIQRAKIAALRAAELLSAAGRGHDAATAAAAAIRVDPYCEAAYRVGMRALGSLGVGTGFAMAAKLAHPKKEVLCYYGDGSFGMNVQDAVDFPRVHHQWQPDRLSLERGISPEDAERLAEVAFAAAR